MRSSFSKTPSASPYSRDHNAAHAQSAATKFCTLLTSLLLIVAAYPFVVQSQEMRFSRIRPEVLPFPNHIGILQDGMGFMWMVDFHYLYRFDGSRYERRPMWGSSGAMQWHDSQQLLAHQFTPVRYAKGIAGGQRGIFCVFFESTADPMLYDLNRHRRYELRLAYDQPIQRHSVSCVTEDRSGRFWIGTDRGAVFCAKPGEDSEVTAVASRALDMFRDTPIVSILEDHLGYIWIAGGSNLVQIDSLQNVIAWYGKSPEAHSVLPPGLLAQIAIGRDAKIWVLMQTGWFGWLDPKTYGSELPPPRVTSGVAVLSMFEDLSGDVWVVTSREGVFRWRRETRHWDLFFTDETDDLKDLPAIISDACLDRDGNVWLVTETEGVQLYARQQKEFRSCTPDFGPPSDMSASFVNALREDHTGTLWIGTMTAGLDYLTPGSSRFRNLRHDPDDARSLSSNHITCICERHNGELWIGTIEGVNVLKRMSKSFVRFNHRNGDSTSLGDDVVTALYEDRAGVLWVGHFSGIDRFDDAAKQFVEVSRWPADKPRGNSVTCFLEDASDRFWVGSGGRGLFLLDRESEFLQPVALGETAVYSIREDAHGDLWLGGANLGLIQFNPNEIFFARGALDTPMVVNRSTWIIETARPRALRTTSADSRSLDSVHVYGSIADEGGMVWLTTRVGIVRLDPHTGLCVFHGEEDGVVVSAGRRHAFIRARDGTIYCGGGGGLSWFHPDSMKLEYAVPHIVMVAVKVLQEPVELPYSGLEAMEVEHTQNMLTFEFSTLDYLGAERCQYEYLLEGTGTGWIALGNQSSVTLAGLGPGEYVLRVRGANSRGNWDEKGIVLPITILPPWWETWFFRSAVIVLVGLLLYGLYRYRLSQALVLERLRLRITDDLHDEIGSDLSAIALESDFVARRFSAKDPRRRRIAAIAASIRESAEDLRDVVWIINPEQDTMQDLAARMRTIAAKMCPEVELKFQTTGGISNVSLEMEFKRHLFLIFKEILHNIVKHAKATSADIEIERKGEFLCLRVTDNGVGFDPSVKTEGHGLGSLRSRAQKIGATLTIESAPGAGTTVYFKGRIARL